MSDVKFARVRGDKAAEIAARFELGEDAQKLLNIDLGPKQYFDLLAEKQLFPDAVRFLAHALPKREAVYWACLCARRVISPGGAEAPPDAAPEPPAKAKARAALEAAMRWVFQPSEENRRAAEAAAKDEGIKSPAGCAAIAAFFTGGSLGPPNVQAIPPDEFMTAQAVAGAVMLSAVVTEPDKAAEKYRDFFAVGTQLAEGKPVK